MHAHFDCFSGISGDMVLGAFVDMGVPVKWLADQIDSLSIGKVDLVAQDVKINGIGAKRMTVVDKTAARSRDYGDIVQLLEKITNEAVRNVAADVFSRIAEAEAQIHRCEKASVHFHEVGAVDSIVDIVGTALCLDYFHIDTVSASPLPLGGGFVDCAHGKLPVPAPATLELVKGFPVYGGPIDGELVTPTGAGILASICQAFGPIPHMTIDRVGYGSGSHDHKDLPNLLRVFCGQKVEQQVEPNQDVVWVVETNIDDMNPELYGYLMEKLFADGALDVCLIPVSMKKNRPGIKVEVICPPEKKATLTRRLFSETTTIGVRYQKVHRYVLKRSFAMVTTRFGDIQVKCTTDHRGRKRCVPEYEHCRQLALEKDIPLKMIYDAVADATLDDDSVQEADS